MLVSGIVALLTGMMKPESNRNTNTAALLDEREAAAHVKITPRTLRLWRRNRGLPYLRLTPRVIRFKLSDLDRWLAEHNVNATD